MKNSLLENKLKSISEGSNSIESILSLLCDDTEKGLDLILSSLDEEQQIQLRDKINCSLASKNEVEASEKFSNDETSSYLGDDRDMEEQATINAYWMNNGDYYLSVSWIDDGLTMNSPSVRFATSGVASSKHPRLPTAVADIYRSIRGEPTSIERMQSERDEAYTVIQKILDKEIAYQDVSDFMLTKFW